MGMRTGLADMKRGQQPQDHLAFIAAILEQGKVPKNKFVTSRVIKKVGVFFYRDEKRRIGGGHPGKSRNRQSAISRRRRGG